MRTIETASAAHAQAAVKNWSGVADSASWRECAIAGGGGGGGGGRFQNCQRGIAPMSENRELGVGLVFS